MTRQECERRLLEKSKEINDILKEYDPESDYLSICICPKDDDYICINNDYWEGHPMISCTSYEDLSDV